MRWRDGTALASTRVTFTHSMAVSTSPHRTPSREYPLSLPLSYFLTFYAVAVVGRWNEEACGNTGNEAELPFWVLPGVHELLLAHPLAQTGSLKVPQGTGL